MSPGLASCEYSRTARSVEMRGTLHERKQVAFFLVAAALLSLNSVPRTAAAQAAPRTSLFNEDWLQAVISIERESQDSKETCGEPAACPIGTGFLVFTKDRFQVLVTAAHVVRNDKTKEVLDRLRYRRTDVTADDAVISEALLSKSKSKEGLIVGEWVFSATHDLAARVFGWTSDKDHNPRGVPDSAFLPAQAQSVGAPVLVLGFPVGLRSMTHRFPIARTGIIARRQEQDLIVEAFVFPGNSGSPVIYVPSLRIAGTNGLTITSPLVPEERLVGVVTSYIPYQEAAVSSQTGRARVVFEENSGLAYVVPASVLSELLKDPRLHPKH